MSQLPQVPDQVTQGSRFQLLQSGFETQAPAMERGGCDITTVQNAVDVSIERRCRDVIDKFLLNQGLSDD